MSGAEDLLASAIAAQFQQCFSRGEKDKGMVVTLCLHHDREAVDEDDYYPRVDLLLWAPSNYVKVFVRERDVHHYGQGQWVKISDHDSGWRDGVTRFVDTYAKRAYGFETFDGWFEVLPIREDDAESVLPGEWGKIEDAAYLPGIHREVVR